MLPNLKGHCRDLIVETEVWPMPFLINMFAALKGSQFLFLFVVQYKFGAYSAGVISDDDRSV